MEVYKVALFDLDGVVVDTAKYHYLAWRRLAETMGFEFTQADNARLKGVSRMQSLEILLEIGGISGLDQSRKEELCKIKNAWYVEYISKMDKSEILEGAAEFIAYIRENGIKTALATASKNAEMILNKLGLKHLFDAVIDGNAVKYPKPNPEVFLKAAEALKAAPYDCVVFEDASAGVEAAKRGGMYAVGIGDPNQLADADTVIKGLHEAEKILWLFNIQRQK